MIEVPVQMSYYYVTRSPNGCEPVGALRPFRLPGTVEIGVRAGRTATPEVRAKDDEHLVDESPLVNESQETPTVDDGEPTQGDVVPTAYDSTEKLTKIKTHAGVGIGLAGVGIYTLINVQHNVWQYRCTPRLKPDGYNLTKTT